MIARVRPARREPRSSRSRRATSSGATAPARSSARQGGFEFEGQGGLGNAITVWIDADLSRYTRAPIRRAVRRVQPGQRRHRQHLDVHRAVERVEHDLRAPGPEAERAHRGVGAAPRPGRDRRSRRRRADPAHQPVGVQPHRRRPVPPRPDVPRRRRRAPPPAGQRAREQHLDAGRLQPGVEARARAAGPGRRRACSTATTPSASRWAARSWTGPTRASARWCRGSPPPGCSTVSSRDAALEAARRDLRARRRGRAVRDAQRPRADERAVQRPRRGARPALQVRPRWSATARLPGVHHGTPSSTTTRPRIPARRCPTPGSGATPTTSRPSTSARTTASP